jgi:hypothetical protein
MDPHQSKIKFRKKVYRKLDTSPLSESIPPPSSFASPDSAKKIIPSSATKGLREDFKKTFLPLLIDVFELRQMIETYKSEKETKTPFPMGKITLSPHEILEQLEQLQNDIEETQRWCDGVILQIAKGIQEAKEALELLDKKEHGLIKKLLKKWKR